MFKNKDQVMVVPVNYVNHISNGFTATDMLTKNSYGLYDCVGAYRPLYEIEKNICLIRISVMILIKNENDEYLVKELKDNKKKPSLEMGINSYVKSTSGNYKAIYNQICDMTKDEFENIPDLKYIGNIRDLANDSVKSILGLVYYAEVNKEDFSNKEKHWLYDYKWYNKKELIDRYNKSTSWSRIITDMIVDESIKELTGRS